MENYNRKLRVFFSFHHRLNQGHYDRLKYVVESLGHENISIHSGNLIENEELKTSVQIRREIRDKYLRNVNVTVVIVGSDSRNRKHIDWEIRSTLHKFVNERDGAIVVVNALNNKYQLTRDTKLQELCGNGWSIIKSFPEGKLSFLPERLENSIINNFSYEEESNNNHKHASFPIITYENALKREVMQRALICAYESINSNRGKWDLDTKMRRHNNERNNRSQFPQVNP